MFKEGNQYACLFNTRKIINGYMEAKYGYASRWNSPCVLCSLFHFDYIFPDERDVYGIIPIGHCGKCSFCPKESVDLIYEIKNHVKQVNQQELFHDIFRNANDMRRGICCYV